MPIFIVATDLSERGDRAVHRGFRLARARQARLIIATVVDDSLPKALADEFARAAEAQLARVVAASPGSDTVTHEQRTLRGDPAPAVALLCATEGADLLILGRHRPRPIADLFRGTTMERIVAQVGCPVLLACAPAADDYDVIVAAVDFSPSAAAAVKTAAALAPQARLAAVHALHVPYRGLIAPSTAEAFFEEARAAETAWRKAHDLPAQLGRIEPVEGVVDEVVATALVRNGADLLALGAHARAALGDVLLGSFATRILRDPPTDLLIARAG